MRFAYKECKNAQNKKVVFARAKELKAGGVCTGIMKFLFISWDALITDIAWKVREEGHDVKLYIRSEGDRDVGDGFVPKVDSYEKHVDWADVIVFDDTLGQGPIAQKLREQGKLVVGGTPYTDKLEDDRSFGQEELKKHKINIIPFTDFGDFDTAIAYVEKNPGRYVLKPSGESQFKKSLLFVGEQDDGSDVIAVMEAYKKAWAKKIPQFQLQKVVVGVEVAVGAFFNGNEFVTPININFENKKLFPGNIGPSTGEMGTLMFWSEPNTLFDETLKKLEPVLVKEKYFGYIDLNCIVNGNGIYPLEFTSRFGYPTISIQQEGMITPIGEFLHGLASGTLKEFKYRKGFQVGLRLVVPPFPYDDPETFQVKSKDSIVHFKKGTEGVHIEDVKLVDDEWIITGSSGVICIVCGTGPSVKQAQQQMYNRVKNILIPHMYYRDDIGDRWYTEGDKLHTWGYLR